MTRTFEIQDPSSISSSSYDTDMQCDSATVTAINDWSNDDLSPSSSSSTEPMSDSETSAFSSSGASSSSDSDTESTATLICANKECKNEPLHIDLVQGHYVCRQCGNIPAGLHVYDVDAGKVFKHQRGLIVHINGFNPFVKSEQILTTQAGRSKQAAWINRAQKSLDAKFAPKVTDPLRHIQTNILKLVDHFKLDHKSAVCREALRYAQRFLQLRSAEKKQSRLHKPVVLRQQLEQDLKTGNAQPIHDRLKQIQIAEWSKYDQPKRAPLTAYSSVAGACLYVAGQYNECEFAPMNICKPIRKLFPDNKPIQSTTLVLWANKIRTTLRLPARENIGSKLKGFALRYIEQLSQAANADVKTETAHVKVLADVILGTVHVSKVTKPPDLIDADGRVADLVNQARLPEYKTPARVKPELTVLGWHRPHVVASVLVYLCLRLRANTDQYGKLSQMDLCRCVGVDIQSFQKCKVRVLEVLFV